MLFNLEQKIKLNTKQLFDSLLLVIFSYFVFDVWAYHVFYLELTRVNYKLKEFVKVNVVNSQYIEKWVIK